MNEKKFNFDISKEKRDALDRQTNKPVEGSDNTYHYPDPNKKDAYEGKVNKEALREKRLEYIDDAILKVIKKEKGVVDARRKWLKEEKFDEETIREDLWSSLGHDIAMELERTQGDDSLISVYGKDKDVGEHWHEFSADVVRKRFFEWDFLNEDDIPKLKGAESVK